MFGKAQVQPHLCISQYLKNENTEMCSYVPWRHYEKIGQTPLRNTFYGVSCETKTIC